MTTVEFLLSAILLLLVVNTLFDERRNREVAEMIWDIRKAIVEKEEETEEAWDDPEKYEERQREFKLRYPKLVEEMGKAVAETAQHLRETGGKVTR